MVIEFKSAGQARLYHGWRTTHPGRVNMCIAKSYKEVTQAKGQSLVRAKILPHIESVSIVETF